MRVRYVHVFFVDRPERLHEPMFFGMYNYNHRVSSGFAHRKIDFSKISAHIKYDIINLSLPRRTIVLLKAKAKSDLRVTYISKHERCTSHVDTIMV